MGARIVRLGGSVDRHQISPLTEYATMCTLSLLGWKNGSGWSSASALRSPSSRCDFPPPEPWTAVGDYRHYGAGRRRTSNPFACGLMTAVRDGRWWWAYGFTGAGVGPRTQSQTRQFHPSTNFREKLVLDTRIRGSQCNFDTCGPGKHPCSMPRCVGAFPSSGQHVVLVSIHGGTFAPSSIVWS